LAQTGVSALVWAGIGKTVLFMFLAPLIGMAIGLAVAVAVAWIFRRFTPRRVDKLFRRGQLLSASLYSLGHGGNDAQKTMGIIFVLLIAATPADQNLHWRDRFALTEKSFETLRKPPASVPDDVLKQLAPLLDRLVLTEKSLKILQKSPASVPEDVLKLLVSLEDKRYSTQKEFEA